MANPLENVATECAVIVGFHLSDGLMLGISKDNQKHNKGVEGVYPVRITRLWMLILSRTYSRNIGRIAPQNGQAQCRYASLVS